MSLILPFTFPPRSGASNISSSLQAGLQERHVECIGSTSARPYKAVALGCSDGSIYVFRPAIGNLSTNKASASSPIEVPTLQTNIQPPSPPKKKHRSKSPIPPRSDSPSLGSHLPFVISPRSHVTSSVTKEQAEAPKNYVDFEEEPGKLKELLKGKSKLSLEESSTTSQSSRPPSFISVSSRVKSQDYDESLKAAQPTSPIASPYSPPVSPAPFPIASERSLFELELAYRVIPRSSGPGAGVSQLQILGDIGSLVVLQRNGFEQLT
jgi:WD repeat-containing protein 7